MHKYKVDYTMRFKKDLKLAVKRGYNIAILNEIVEKLQNGETLPEKNKNHMLTGNWKGYCECHIAPDWLLVYRIYENELLLVLSRTGSHSDLGF